MNAPSINTHTFFQVWPLFGLWGQSMGIYELQNDWNVYWWGHAIIKTFNNYSFTIDFCQIKCHCLWFSGHHNLSYIIDGQFGRSEKFDFTLLNFTSKSLHAKHIFSFFRSLPDIGFFNVSSLNKLSMFQTYAGVDNIYSS